VPPVPPPAEHGRRSGVTAGIVLIVIGAIFLLAQFVPGVAWWNLWPLIIIVAGLIQAFTPGKEGWSVVRLFDGFVTVAFGLVFLAIMTGVVGWSVWGTILSLWPILLIAIGLDLLGKALQTSWLRVLGSLAIIVGLAYAVAISAGQVRGVVLFASPDSATVTFDEPVGNVREAMLDLDAGVAQVTLEDGDALVEGEATSPWGDPDVSVERSGSTADVVMSLGDAESAVLVPGGPDAGIDASLARDVVWDMVIKAGVATVRADLADVQVRSLTLKPGVTDCNVTLGEVPSGEDETAVEVESGVSSVRLAVPEDAEVQVVSDSGLTGLDIDSSIEDAGDDTWQTPGFASAAMSGRPVIRIRVKSGVGSFAVDTY